WRGTGLDFLGRGIWSWRLAATAWQCWRTGHRRHCGFLGVQRVAPSSMRAELKSPAFFFGRISWARDQSIVLVLRSLGSDWILSRRQRTLVTLPSRMGALMS